MSPGMYDVHPDETIVEDEVLDAKSEEAVAYQILCEMAETYRERNKVYGDNWRKVGDFLAALFPNGVTLEKPEDHNRYHFLVMIAVKLTRYAQNWDRGGHEDSLLDSAVYSAILAELDREIGK